MERRDVRVAIMLKAGGKATEEETKQNSVARSMSCSNKKRDVEEGEESMYVHVCSTTKLDTRIHPAYANIVQLWLIKIP